MADKVMAPSSTAPVLATAIPDGASFVSVSWSSNDEDIVTVAVPDPAHPESALLQSAGENGQAVITAQGIGTDGVSHQDQKTVQVAEPATGLAISFP